MTVAQPVLIQSLDESVGYIDSPEEPSGGFTLAGLFLPVLVAMKTVG